MSDPTSTTPPVKQDPIGIEIAITGLQLELQTIPWLEVSYGRAFLIPEEDSQRQVPAVYTGGRHHKVVLPNDNFKSQSFIAVTSPETFVEFTLNAVGQTKEADIAIIIWMNFEKIDRDESDFFRELLKKDVEKILAFNEHIITIEEVIDEDAFKIFAGYEIDIKERECLMWPYGGFRFNCKIGYESFCQ